MEIDQLTPIREFPGYYADLKHGKIYSNRGRGLPKNPTLKELSVIRGRYVNLQIGGKPRLLMITRLLATASFNMSYDELPQNVLAYWSEEEGVKVRMRSEVTTDMWKRRKAQIQDQREERLDNTIKALMLLREAYHGNSVPLLNYLYSRKRDYINSMYMSYHFSYRRICEGFEYAFTRLINHLKGEPAVIRTVDGWIWKTALGHIKEEMKREKLLEETTYNIKVNVL